MIHDPRLTPARGDIAASFLRGEVEAERFVDGVAHQVSTGCAALLASPAASARRETELLFGETFTIYDARDGYAWGQSGVDSYVGYVAADALTAPPLAPTHRVGVHRTTLIEAPNIKSALLHSLSRNAKLRVDSLDGAFAREGRGGFVPFAHLEPIQTLAADFVSVAEGFAGLPYLWGGRGALGFDCSGLVQICLETAGIAAPRDTDMQEAALGVGVVFDDRLAGLQRGDLIFWDGHAGIMADGARLVHANSHHMMVAIEPLQDAAVRMTMATGPIRAIKRL